MFIRYKYIRAKNKKQNQPQETELINCLVVYAIRKKQNILTDILFELDIKNIDEINYKGKK